MSNLPFNLSSLTGGYAIQIEGNGANDRDKNYAGKLGFDGQGTVNIVGLTKVASGIFSQLVGGGTYTVEPNGLFEITLDSEPGQANPIVIKGALFAVDQNVARRGVGVVRIEPTPPNEPVYCGVATFYRVRPVEEPAA